MLSCFDQKLPQFSPLIPYFLDWIFKTMIVEIIYKGAFNPFIVYCNAAALPMYRLLIYRSSTQWTSPQLHFLAVPQCSSRHRDGNTTAATYCNAAAVDYKSTVRVTYILYYMHSRIEIVIFLVYFYYLYFLLSGSFLFYFIFSLYFFPSPQNLPQREILFLNIYHRKWIISSA